MRNLKQNTAVGLSILLCFCAATALQARQRELLDAGWRFHRNELDGNRSVAPPGVAVRGWVWIADDETTNDAATMAAPGLDTSTWSPVTVGTDVFNGRVGSAWFRSVISASALPFQPVRIYCSGVDDNAWVYLNGVLIGQHQGWAEAFSISIPSSAWIEGGSNVLAVAVQNTGGPGGISQPVLLQSASPQIQPPGIPVTQWVWMRDTNGPDDALEMAATNLDTSAWPSAAIGQDVFNGAAGWAWFRASLDGLTASNRPLVLHFLSVADKADIYLNGTLLGRHTGGAQPFDLLIPAAAWSDTGPNVLALQVQSTGGSGGILGPVLLQSGKRLPPPGMVVERWAWTNDSDAPLDAGALTATNLDTSTWPSAAYGQDLFQDGPGAGWLRASLDSSATGGRPLTLHCLGFGPETTAKVYLNGYLLGTGTGAFDLPIPEAVWIDGGPNILAVALQAKSGPGGLLNPVLLQSGEDLEDFSPADPDFNDSLWRTVHLPHDYIVEGTFTNTAETSHASLPLANAWYRLKFLVPASAGGQSVWINFDGVYHNSRVWINGHYLGYWYSGYAPFQYDVSRFVVPGQTNVLAVHVDPHGDEGWWYEGGGIYRHVWMTIAAPLHVQPWGTFVTSAVHGPEADGNASATLTLTTTLTNAGPEDQSCTLRSTPVGPEGVAVGAAETAVTVAAGTATNVVQSVEIAHARLWSLDTPQLYQLHTAIEQSGQTIDSVETPFGIRSIRFDPDRGFFLNGQRVEIKGMCNHQDFAGVGIGIPDTLLYWRIMKLKEMGANAYRCAHNPPTQALLDACDRLGMLVMDENRHLGDSTGGYSSATAQTTYANLAPLSNMILRDRNHPSIILWSMCNEESISGTQAGADIFEAMKARVWQFDTSRPVTCAMNSGWFNVGISLVEDVEGFNYSPGLYDSFHQTFPSQPIYGSETSSAMADRGVYTNDGSVYMSSYNSPENAWKPVVERPFLAGSFTWTGFDYKGEPHYGWPCISSKYGVMDLCGLPKDMFYYYQAWWGNRPLVHLFPHWNWSVGQTISVWCYANTATVELFLNGASQGLKTVPAYGHVQWSVPYAPGTLSAKGYDAEGYVVATDRVVTAGAPASVELTSSRTVLSADDEDATVVYASIRDAQGNLVPNASNRVSFAVEGPAYLDGVGNGDPASHEPDRASQRHAFNGWCMALVGAHHTAGPISLVATSPGLAPATLTLQADATNSPPAAPTELTAGAGNGRASLRWGLSFRAVNYHVKRSTVSGGPYTTVAHDTAVAFEDTGLTNGVTYYYVVSAANDYGESANSPEVRVVPYAPPPPPVPEALTAQRDDGQVILHWAATTNTTAYQVKRALARTGPYTRIANVATTGYTDPGLTNGTTYYYRVSALDGSLESADSDPVSATPESMSFLVGTSLGTTGSWNNVGNIREMALDGNSGTFFDPPTANAWVGIDLGTHAARVISKIRYVPRAGYESRMVGGVFQGANQPDFSDAVALASVTDTPPDGFNSVFPANTNAFRYLRYLTASSNWCNLAELEFYSPGPHVYRLTGTVLGDNGSPNAGTNSVTNALDGDITTFFDSPESNGNWVGLDLGSPTMITHIRFFPRPAFADRMNGGIFQGANNPAFSPAVNLLTLSNSPPDGTFTAAAVTNTTRFRYVRYLSPDGSHGDVAEAQFYGPSPGLPSGLLPPAGLTTTPGHAEIALSWDASSGAAGYYVKRARISGGPYTIITTNTATLWMNVGLPAGTYYYVVSAFNANGQSADSIEANATVSCALPPQPFGLAATAKAGRLLLVWSPVSTGTSPTAYYVFRSTNLAGPYALVASALTGTGYCDTSVISGTSYYYWVEAVNACGQGSASAPLATASLAAPQFNASPYNGGLRLSWPSWAADYTVLSTTNLARPESWQPVTASPWSSNGTVWLNLTTTNAAQAFFRLAAPTQ